MEKLTMSELSLDELEVISGGWRENMSSISIGKKKSKKIGIIFFSLLLIINLCMQIYNYFNDKDFKWLIILGNVFVILVCRYFFDLENYLKNKGWL